MLPLNIKSLILDMDGVLWTSDQPIGHLPSIFSQIDERQLNVAFVTNNGTRTSRQYVDRLRGFGIEAKPEQVFTSALGVVYLLQQKFSPGSNVFVIGELGVREALSSAGYVLLSLEDASNACAVVMGHDKAISFEKMREATLLVGNGVPFYATNMDKTFPTPRGEIPGAGAWISVITTATGIQPIVAGKPYPYLINMAREYLGTCREDTLVVGDRLETDILGGQNAGCPVALVLSGVSSRTAGETWDPPIDLISDNLASLLK